MQRIISTDGSVGSCFSVCRDALIHFLQEFSEMVFLSITKLIWQMTLMSIMIGLGYLFIYIYLLISLLGRE